LGLRPQINLSDVRIYDAEGREALVLPSVQNILSWRSLADGELRLHALAIEGPRLAIRRDSAGTFYIAGMKLAADSGDSKLGDWILGQQRIEIRGAEVEWRDEKRAAPPLVVSAIDLRVTNDGARHSLGLVGRPPAALGANLELRAEFSGESLERLRGWDGRVYAELGHTDFAAWRPWIDYPMDVQRGQGAVRVWANVAAGALQDATADVAVTDVAARFAADLPLLELPALSGRLIGRRGGEAVDLTLSKLTVTAPDGAKLPSMDLQLSLKPGGGAGSANSLELAPIARFAEGLPLPQEWRRAIAELAPQGRLADLRFDWQGAMAAPVRYRATGRFSELGSKPRDTVPGFARLSGTLEASEAGGKLELQTRGARVELPRVFPEPRLEFEALTGMVEWRRDGERIRFTIPSLTFSNADLSGNAFGAYEYDGDGPGRIDVSAILNRADARNLARYLPLGRLMGEKTREWLVQGIVAGQASEVELRLQGDLREFPFKQPSQGQFRVAGRVDNGELQYAEGWPRIQNIQAQLVFERDRMEIAGRSGTLLGARLHDIGVTVASIGTATPRVAVNGQAQGPTAEFLRFLQSSPLRSTAGRFTEPMRATGDGRLRLRLDLPLADLEASKVAGEFQFTGNRVTLAPELPPFEDARGRLVFTDSSFAVQEARARIFGGAVAISGGTRPNGAMEFVARGEAQPAALTDHPLRRHLSGAGSYVAAVSLRDGLQRVVVESSLRGVAISLPPPFEKPAADALPLRVEFVPAEGGRRDRIAVSLGRVAGAEVHRRREGEAMEVRRAAVSFAPPAGQPIRMPERSGVLVYGSLPTLDADRWRAVLAGETGSSPLPAQVDLKLARLQVSGKRIHNLAVRGSSDVAGWSAVVDADEMAGQLSYKREGRGLFTARFLHFSVPRTVAEASGPAPRPGELPALDLVAERFDLRGKQLGRVELAGQPDGADWRVDRLAVLNPDATVLATGRWRDGAKPASELEFTLDAADAGRFLARVGYPGMVAGGKAQLAGALRWQGEPAALDYASLTGEVRLNAEEGEFLEIEPGLGKLISLMNLQALPRRIALDFRDVFSKGFRFDRIDAHSQLDRGVMDLREFRMRGPAAEVAMSGQVNLASETQNLKVRVVPSLGDTASTALAIVNPIAGVATAIASRVLKNPLGQIFAHEFEVTGAWTDPKVAKLSSLPMASEPLKP
ncbi:MAG TPA: YhdP family protein, partial [Burkholderiales bacterium]|nr:YhdP family protein [Burkholderiales bacterium]